MRTSRSPMQRYLACFLIPLILNLGCQGPLLAASFDQQRRVELANQRTFERLGLSPHASDRAEQRRAQARGTIAKTRAADLEKQAQVRAHAEQQAQGTRLVHAEALVDGLHQVARELQAQVAEHVQGRPLSLPADAATILLYRYALREGLIGLEQTQRRTLIYGDPQPSAQELAMSERLHAVLAPLNTLPDEAEDITGPQLSSALQGVAEVLTRLAPPPSGSGDRHPQALGFDPVAGKVKRPALTPPPLNQVPGRTPRSEAELLELFGEEALVVPPAPGLDGLQTANQAGDEGPEALLAPPRAATAKSQAPPTTADLAETPETHITPELQALVDQLEGDPLALYQYVLSQIAYEPYHGARQGAAGTLSRGSGSDADTASLLIALYRAAGIPARYEYGTVEIPAEQLPPLLGFTHYASAATTMASQGVPLSTLNDGNGPSKTRLEKVWVRAYLPYDNYRGQSARPDSPGGSRWVALDPAFKPHVLKNRVDVRNLATFDQAGFLAAETTVSPLNYFAEGLRTALLEAGLDCPTLEDGRFRPQPAPLIPELLPTTLPYTLYTTPVAASSLPSKLRYTLTFELTDSYGFPILSKGFTLPEIFAQRLALTFPSGSSLDSALSGSVKPTLSLNDVKQASTSGMSAGTEGSVYLTISRPGASAYVRTHKVTAGGTYVFNIEYGQIHPDRIKSVEAELQQLKSSGASQGTQDRRLAQLAGLLYANALSSDDLVATDLEAHYYAAQYVFMTGADVTPKYFFGIPNGALADGYSIDAEELLFLMPRTSAYDATKALALMNLIGTTGSFWEHALWGSVISKGGLSSTNLLQLSKQQGMTQHFLDSYSEYQAIKSQLSHPSGVIANVEQTLQGGGKVVIADRILSYGGRTISGYILQDSSTGSGRYLIYEQQGGGVSVDAEIISWVITVGYCALELLSDANAVTGELLLQRNDLSLAANGPSLTLLRTYRSVDALQGVASPLGPGWVFRFNTRIEAPSSSERRYIDGAGERWTFTKQPNGTWLAPATLQASLSQDAQGYTLVDPQSYQLRFDSTGKLQQVTDTAGLQLQLLYDGQQQLVAVEDALGRTALTFSWDAGRIVGVEDVAGRSLEYGYTNGLLTSFTDADAHTWTYTYYTNGLLGEVRGPDGRSVFYTFDRKGRTVSYANEREEAGYIGYDDVNRRTTHTRPDGGATLYTFDEAGRCTSITDANGNKTEKTYQDEHLTSATAPRGGQESMTYDDEGNLSQLSEPDGTTRTFEYEPGTRRLTQVSDGSRSLSYDYDDVNGKVTRTTADGRQTVSQRNSEGQLTRFVREDGSEFQLGYDPITGLPSTFTEVSTEGVSRQTVITRDAAGRMTSAESPDGLYLEMGYTGNGQLASMGDARGPQFFQRFDGRGNLIEQLDTSGRSQQYQYDYGHLTRATNVAGQTRTFEYDSAGRLIADTNYLGHTRTTTYDKAGRVLAETDTLGNRTDYGWCADVREAPCDIIDADGNLTQLVLDAEGRPLEVQTDLGTTRFTRDGLGRVLTSTNSLNQTTQYSWSGEGQLASVILPGGGETRYQYNAAGKLTQLTDARNQVTTYEYSDQGQLQKVTYPSGKSLTIGYHPSGLRETLTWSDGVKRVRQFSPLRAVTQESWYRPDGSLEREVRFTYDPDGRMKTARIQDGSVIRSTLSFTHGDALGNLTQVQESSTGSTLQYTWDSTTRKRTSLVGPGGTQRVVYDDHARPLTFIAPDGGQTRLTYDARGRISHITRPNKTVEERRYDRFGRIEARLHWNGGGQLVAGESLRYDSESRLLSSTDEQGRVTSYTYNLNGQLVGVSGPLETRTFEYDAVGNRTRVLNNGVEEQQCSYNSLGQPITCTAGTVTTSYQYDGRGNLIQKQEGALTSTYSWSLSGQLLSATTAAGTVTYGYDALGRLIERTDAAGTSRFVHDVEHMVAELDGAGQLVRRYLYGFEVDGPLAVVDVSSSTPQTYYFHADARRNILALSSSTGQVVSRQRYSAYGSVLEQSGGVSSPLGFGGRPFDATVGLNELRARWYQPGLGAFTQPDPVSPETMEDVPIGMAAYFAGRQPTLAALLQDPLSQNRYGYGRGAPTQFGDPSGGFKLAFLLGFNIGFTNGVIESGTRNFSVILSAWKFGDVYRDTLLDWLGTSSGDDGPEPGGEKCATPPSGAGGGGGPAVDPWGIPIAVVWTQTLKTVLDPIKNDLLSIRYQAPVTGKFPLPCGYIQRLVKCTIKISEEEDIGVYGLVGWILIGWFNYFLLLNFLMIYLFQMPTGKIEILFECGCAEKPSGWGVF